MVDRVFRAPMLTSLAQTRGIKSCGKVSEKVVDFGSLESIIGSTIVVGFAEVYSQLIAGLQEEHVVERHKGTNIDQRR